MEQATRDNRTQVTTIDLLVALLREGEGVAAGILWQQGVNLERLRSLAQQQV